MKPTYFFLLAFFTCFSMFSQSNFVEGYFINTTGYRTECLVRNNILKNLPSFIEYKTSQDTEVQIVSIETIKEFGIPEQVKYVKKRTQVDVSSADLNDIGYIKEPLFEDREVFLKVLVEGDATLYFYDGVKKGSYYYETRDVELQPLVYKAYLEEGSYKILKNNEFKKQIHGHMTCEGIDQQSTIRNAEYKERDLTQIFEAYNSCKNTDFVIYKKPKTKLDLNLSIRPGVNFYSLEILSPDPTSIVLGDVDYGSQTNFRVGVELELVIPTGSNQLGFFFEPTYRSFEASSDEPIGMFEYESSVSYQALDLNLGLRYYLALTEKSKVFINVAHAYELNLGDSKVEYEGTPEREDREINSNGFFSVGMGYQFLNRFSTEFRYCTNRNLFGNYVDWNTNHSGFAIILGYKLF